LRRISSELKLPEPTKSRILLEMASDLEGLTEHYRSRGLPEEEAAQRAEQKLLASPESLQHLIAVHTTSYQRWASRAAGRLRWGFDLLLFVVGVLPMLIACALVIAARAPSLGASPLAWPIGVAALAIAGIAGVKAYDLFVRRERSTARLHRGLPTLVLLGIVGPMIGLFAALLGLYRLAIALSAGTIDPAAYLAVTEQAGRDATVLALGLLLAFGAGLVWFVLVNRVSAIEQSESAALLGGE
jgi:hypothetical protein